MAIPCNNIGDKKPQMRLLEWSSLVTTQKVLCLAWNKLMNLNFRLTSSFSLRKLFFILDQIQLDVQFVLNQMDEGLKNFTKLKWREIGSIAKLMQFIDYINCVCVCFPSFWVTINNNLLSKLFMVWFPSPSCLNMKCI